MQIKLKEAFLCLAFSAGIVTAVSGDTKLRDGTVLSDKPLFIVSYVEVAPGSESKAADLIKKQAAVGKTEKGNLNFEALQRIGRKNHFVVLETWTDPAARDNHAKGAHTIAYRKALQPLLYNPYDERPHVGLVAGDPTKIKKGTPSSVYAITHVDIIPPEQFPPCKRQVKETGPCGNALVEQLVKASQKHKGVARFDALTQSNRSNHMTVVEQWHSEADRAAHQVTSDVKNFRDALSGIVPGSGVNSDPLFVLNPMTGSLYDERLYKLVN